MTLSLALKCIDPNTGKNALLFAADNQVFKGPLKAKAEKLWCYAGPDDVEEYGIVMSFSGDTYLCEEVFFDLIDLFNNKIEENTKELAIELLNIKKEIGDVANSIYQKYRARGLESSQFELLVGACDEEPTILHVNHEGKTHYTQNFGMIGHGQVSGGLLLLNKFYDEDMSILEAATLSSMIIDSVSEVDPTVSNNIDYKVCIGGKARIFSPEVVEGLSHQNSIRWDFLKNIYRHLLIDPSFESELRKFLGY